MPHKSEVHKPQSASSVVTCIWSAWRGVTKTLRRRAHAHHGNHQQQRYTKIKFWRWRNGATWSRGRWKCGREVRACFYHRIRRYSYASQLFGLCTLCLHPTGSIAGGLVCHPDQDNVIYSLGCKIIVESLATSKQMFLSGHTNNISCLTCSRSGQYLASGQITHMGFKADVIVWNFPERKMHCRLTLHKVRVQALAFSPTDKYLATLGGQDDNWWLNNFYLTIIILPNPLIALLCMHEAGEINYVIHCYACIYLSTQKDCAFFI